MPLYTPTGSDSYGAVSSEARDHISKDLHRKAQDAETLHAKDGIDSGGGSATESPLKWVLAGVGFLAVIVFLICLLQ